MFDDELLVMLRLVRTRLIGFGATLLWDVKNEDSPAHRNPVRFGKLGKGLS